MKMLRNALIAGLLAAAWFLPAGRPAPFAPVPSSDAPSEEMQQRVADIAVALRPASSTDKAIWHEVWKKAALIVASDAVEQPPLFATTDKLRKVNVVSLNIAWRRLNGNQPGKYDGLSEATEKAFAETLGMESKPVSEDVRASYVELCEALAWAASPQE
jgi:hypothetical protein